MYKYNPMNEIRNIAIAMSKRLLVTVSVYIPLIKFYLIFVSNSDNPNGELTVKCSLNCPLYHCDYFTLAHRRGLVFDLLVHIQFQFPKSFWNAV